MPEVAGGDWKTPAGFLHCESLLKRLLAPLDRIQLIQYLIQLKI
jgi:hypothetical protein